MPTNVFPIWSAVYTFGIMFGPHIVLAAWALSRLSRGSMSEAARAQWTIFITIGYLFGPMLYLLRYYRRDRSRTQD